MTAIQTTDNGRLVRSKSTEEKTLAKLIVSMSEEIKRALPKHVTPDRMARIVLTALRTTKDLDKCSPASFLGCVLSLAQLGLEPNTPMGHAWLIPRKIKGNHQCTVIIGYQGYIELAYRSGKVTRIYGEVVRAGDLFHYELGLHPDIKHEPRATELDPKLISHAYAVANIRDAEPAFVVMTRAQIEARRQRSAASGAGPWVTDFESMAKKTPVRELRKWIPQSAELARAAAIDEAPELGLPQSAAFSDEVSDALQSEGLEVIDHETGEVLSEGADEPGSNG